MDLPELTTRANEIKHLYAELNRRDGHRQWGMAEYVQGFVGDVGALVKLTMAREHFRAADDVDRRIAHELVDCFWSVLVIADELGLDLETEFVNEMTKLEQRIGPVHEESADSGNG